MTFIRGSAINMKSKEKSKKGFKTLPLEHEEAFSNPRNNHAAVRPNVRNPFKKIKKGKERRGHFTRQTMV